MTRPGGFLANPFIQRFLNPCSLRPLQYLRFLNLRGDLVLKTRTPPSLLSTSARSWRTLTICPGFGQDRVNFHQNPGRDAVGQADPTWPNRAAILFFRNPKEDADKF